MAQRTEVILTCDVHDGEATAEGTTTLVVNGLGVEIDLCDEHFQELRADIAPFLEYGRSISPRRAKQAGGGKRTRSGRTRDENAAIRTWAQNNGWSGIGERGRISAEIIDAFNGRKK